jgi:predicted HicB family RNase H-like nuclease
MGDTVGMNFEMPDDLHRKAKAKAALRGQSLKDFVIDAIRAAVEAKED